MKKVAVIFAALIFVLASSTAYAGQFGPPEPTAKEGKAALGIGYFYSQTKSKPKDTTNFEEGKSTQNSAYLQLGYGVAKDWEVYARVGAADLKSKKAFEFDNSTPDAKDGYKMGGTIGAKGVFNVSDSFGIGPFFQASIASSYEDTETGTLTGDFTKDGTDDTINTEKLKFKNPWEVNLGIALQAKIGEAIIYGGPVAYWQRTKIEATFSGTDGATGNPIIGTGSVTYKEKNNIGGFAGVRIPLSKSLNLEVEGQMKSRFSMGGALTYSF